MSAPPPFTFRDVFGCDFGKPNVLASLEREVQTNDFWHNRVIAMGADFESRLTESCRYLPLPAAFEQISIACRGAIRPLRKAGADYTIWLARLYGIAVLKNLTEGESEFKKQLDSILVYEWNALWHIPLTTWEGLVIDYSITGYRELRSIKATDIKWVVAAWGEPSRHTSMRSQNPNVWRNAVRLLMEAERAGFNGTWDDWVAHRIEVRKSFDAMRCVSGTDWVPPKITPAVPVQIDSSRANAARPISKGWTLIGILLFGFLLNMFFNP